MSIAAVAEPGAVFEFQFGAQERPRDEALLVVKHGGPPIGAAKAHDLPRTACEAWTKLRNVSFLLVEASLPDR
jgi:hypothetical protein